MSLAYPQIILAKKKMHVAEGSHGIWTEDDVIQMPGSECSFTEL